MNNCNCCCGIVKLKNERMESAFVHLTQCSSNKNYCGINRHLKQAGLQWFSSNKHTLQIFSNQPQTACYNGWSLYYTIIEKIDG